MPNPIPAACGGDRLGQAIAIIILLVSAVAQLYVINRLHKSCIKTLSNQQGTIQRLINREPVTYQEVGKEAPEPKYERYSAWSGEMVDINEE